MRLIDERRLTASRKLKILERDNNICQYCLREGDQVDHIVPWAYIHDDTDSNLLTACWLCNSIAGAKVFDSFDEKRSHILARRNEILKNKIISVFTEGELEHYEGRLKEYLAQGSIICSNLEEKKIIEYKLLKFGYRVA